jgi:hypothetical protein
MDVFGIGKWNRCVKETQDYYRNIDYDEVYPADVDLSKHFVIRKLAPDFLRVPRGIMSCFLTGMCLYYFAIITILVVIKQVVSLCRVQAISSSRKQNSD